MRSRPYRVFANRSLVSITTEATRADCDFLQSGYIHSIIYSSRVITLPTVYTPGDTGVTVSLFIYENNEHDEMIDSGDSDASTANNTDDANHDPDTDS